MKSPADWRRCLLRSAAAASVGALWPALAAGQVTLDGTTGQPAALAGPSFRVGAQEGQLRGGNLFHSFGQLNLGAGESLTFTGPSTVRNVAARVTGGSPSTIAGTVRVDISGANLLLVNPAGVVFHEGGRVDVSGSVVVTTADFVRLADGGRFDATRPADSVLTSAAPAAFGFLSPAPAAIRLENGGGIGVNAGRVLSVAGGDVQLADGQLFAAGGRVNVVATRGPAEVSLDMESLEAGIDVAGAAPRGDVSLTGGSQINVDSVGGNRVVIRGGNLTLEGSSVSAQTFGAADGGGIDIALTGDMTLTDGTLDTSSFGAGRGGDIDIRAHGVTVDGRAAPLTTAIRSEPGGVGTRGGSIRVATTPGDASAFVRVLDAGQISTTSFGPADGGDIRVDSATVVLDGTRAALVEDAVTGIVARTAAPVNGGRGGNVEVVASGAIEIVAGAVISADTFGSGAGGDVTVTAGDLLIDGRVRNLGPFAAGERPPFTGITSGSFGGEFAQGEPTLAFGTAGSLRVDVANDLILRDGASLASAAFFADAQVLDVRVGRNVDVRGNSRITTESGGNGGDIAIAAGGRFRSDRGVVIARAVDPLAGAGGNIDFNPATAALSRSTVRADAVAENAGNIRTTTDAFLSSSDTVISATSENGADGAIDVPDVDIAAGLVRLPESLFDDMSRLQALCGLRIAGQTSSFIYTGRGGVPAAPGGWTASLELAGRVR